ncbi:DUF3083 family protein [Thalassotalea sp. Y01]|uniref:DUF3083 family protein n=1 Tax=Thalassotalea sp. Y01 TaxID=2729613 RepID=UPI00145FAF43|nr:DUF3083 family protein [Thalassotalea sp. Y01]NMP17663.1 DUF3083 family protein [Thalassotalea sp. Y01]
MLQSQSRIGLIRKRSAQHKVLVPANVRENQYILVEFKPNLALLELIAGSHGHGVYFTDFYRNLSHSFFNLCERHGFENVSFIGKNKLVRVMYAQEQQVLETDQQILFMYDPSMHTGLTTFFNADVLADKIQLLFLATGDELRFNAPQFHAGVTALIEEFANLLKVDVGSFKVRDHQHLTYDVFARKKGCDKSITHSFRPITKRYQQQSLLLPADNNDMTFAVVNLPIHRQLLQFCEIDEAAPDPYNPLYTFVSDKFVKIAKQYNLNQLAIIANGKIPIIRRDNENYVLPKGELLNLGFKPVGSEGLYVSQWDSKNLVDSIRLVFIASQNDINKYGYGRFVNHLSEAVRQLANELNYSQVKDSIVLRFHQHLMYSIPSKANKN